MDRGLGPGDMHIAIFIGLVQRVGYLVGPRKKILILTSSTQLSKMYYLTLKLIGYFNLLLL